MVRPLRKGNCWIRAGAIAGVIAAVLPLLAAASLAAQAGDTLFATLEVVPGAIYEAGGFRRFLLGTHYRDVWTTPITVPVLDLQRFAGGLIPVSAHAGSQTRSLRFSGADGRRYQFRSVFKTPTAGLSAELQRTLVADLLQDGASASHPGGTLVVSPLLEAAAVLHPEPVMAVMPDDPALGEFRAGFAGLLGTIEERPNEASEGGQGGFGEALRVIGPERLFERIDDGPEDQVDTRAFLTARLMDILFGDRDRHRDNFRWALMDESGPVRYWLPISRDHDEAFVKLDGWLLHGAAAYYPQLASFGPEFSSLLNLNWHSREVDRRFLVGLDRAVWDSTATWIQERLTDAVIESAVRALPAGMFEASTPALTQALLARRDQLRDVANRYYELLAKEVEIHATNAPERLDVTRIDDQTLEVTLREKGEDREPYLSRRFLASETREVRINMWGGRDQVVVRGSGDPGIILRIVGGSGRDELADSSRVGRVRFYDAGDRTSVALGPASGIDRRPYDEWIGSDLDRYPPREWGSWRRPLPWIFVEPDVGVVFGASYVRTRYGFRKAPYSSQVALRAGYAVGDGWGKVAIESRFYRQNSRVHLDMNASLSGIDIVRYYGLGNDTKATGRSQDFIVEFNQFRAEPSVVRPLTDELEVEVGAGLAYSSTHGDESALFRAVRDTLYGAGDFGRVSVTASLEWDHRVDSVSGTPGLWIRTSGRIVPPVWDVQDTYSEVTGEVRAYLSAPPATRMRPTLALRVGAKKIFGPAPFQDAAYLGGRTNLRGWSTERFAGDAAMHGSAEVRVFLTRFQVMLPGDFGVFGLFDAGRVYVDGNSPGGWHTGVGGGIWFAFVDTSSAVSLAIARSVERTAFYAGLGFAY